MYDFNARLYSPVFGRFLSADTIVPSPGDPQGLNRYSYTLNNPLRYRDPTGHSAEDAGYFLLGVFSQLAYDNAWFLPTQQQALSVKANEPEPMQVGRHVGNLVAMYQSVAEMVDGAGAMVGGALACGTGVLCSAGAPALVAGAAVATHGVGVAGTAVAQEGQMLGSLLLYAKAHPPGQQAAPVQIRIFPIPKN